MALLGEYLRYFGPEPLSDEIVAQHTEIDLVMESLYTQMHNIGPKPRRRLSPLKDPRVGTKVFYKPESLNGELTMAAWLETSRGLKDEGPEVRLYTQEWPGQSFLECIGHLPRERVTAFAGKLMIHATHEELDNRALKLRRFESAMNILTDIGETLDLIAQAEH